MLFFFNLKIGIFLLYNFDLKMSLQKQRPRFVPYACTAMVSQSRMGVHPWMGSVYQSSLQPLP